MEIKNFSIGGVCDTDRATDNDNVDSASKGYTVTRPADCANGPWQREPCVK